MCACSEKKGAFSGGETRKEKQREQEEVEKERKKKLAAERANSLICILPHRTHRKHAPERRCPEADHRHLEACGPERAAR